MKLFLFNTSAVRELAEVQSQKRIKEEHAWTKHQAEHPPCPPSGILHAFANSTALSRYSSSNWTNPGAPLESKIEVFGVKSFSVLFPLVQRRGSAHANTRAAPQHTRTREHTLGQNAYLYLQSNPHWGFS